MTGHELRVGALAWKEYVVSSGSCDRSILHRDVRVSEHYIQRLAGHKREVCRLEWSVGYRQLASGSDDNRVLIWDGMNTDPLWKFSAHQGAVKGITWSPHQSNLLASGGGKADMKIRCWNTGTGAMVQEVNTGSQICNLAWSKNSNELISTNGSGTNQIMIWKYPSLTHVASLTSHASRVLYLAISPSGEAVVTGAGDQTLRFWDCFRKQKRQTNLEAFNNVASIR